MSKRKSNNGGNSKNGQQYKFSNDKIKIEGLKRKKRRMKLRAKGGNEEVIEKFAAQSSKTAKYGKSIVKKKEVTDLGISSSNNNDTVSNSGIGGSTTTGNN
mmetsp:Transcript_130/g.246  ORF Transcript_130/g.246 Transcript_130/m.246 type:complete len:101 (+) Transcript_130:690-992(+)